MWKRGSIAKQRTSSHRARCLSANIAELDKAPDAKQALLAGSLKRFRDYYRQMEQWADAEHAYKRAVAFCERRTPSDFVASPRETGRELRSLPATSESI